MLILFSIDGMRPDGMMQADAPTMHRLFREGVSTLEARTVMPSVTLPCHTSMMRGVDVPRHGITMNQFIPLARPVPSIMDQAAKHDRRVGTFVNWGPLRDLHEPESVITHQFFDTTKYEDGDLAVAQAAARSLPELDFAFVYFGRTDHMGHQAGWMSEPYLEAIADADRCVARVLEAAPNDTTVILLSDHGGHDRSHGTEMPEDMTIPFVLWGAKASPRSLEGMRIFHTAGIAAEVLDLKPHDDWELRA